MSYVDPRAVRKERGAFFTPEPIASFIARWALREGSDRVLEPSCGEAVFLRAAAARLSELGGGGQESQLVGVDLDAASVDRARRLLEADGTQARLSVGDFFDFLAPAPVQAVIGNPPYIRYQDFRGPSRLKAQRAALAQGVRLTNLASSWAAFTVHATSFLAEGGRLGLVLPAELLSVNYAAEVREYLLRSFTAVRLVLFTQRVFPDVQEEVVLLLAEGFSHHGPGVDHFELVQLANLAALERSSEPSTWRPQRRGDRWTPALASSPAYALLTGGQASTLPAAQPAQARQVPVMTPEGPDATPLFGELSTWGRITLGGVSGANHFFALSPQRAKQEGLRKQDLLPLSPPGSTHLRSLVLDDHALAALGRSGARTLLFSPAGRPSAAGRRYIVAGEATGVHQAYKCRVRSPWWRVPLPEVADLFVTYMNNEAVALCANEARVHHLNSVHGLYLTEEAKGIGAPVLALAASSSVTALSAELVGRSYGGGLLKLEPREAARLAVPALALVRRHREELAAFLPQARRLLVQAQHGQVREQVDAILGLADVVGAQGLEELRSAHHQLATRRRSRAKGPQ